MQEKQISGCALKVSPIGIGTWAWGEKLLWGYGKDYDFESLKQVFEYAGKAGINFFDTAEVYGYGNSEKILGELMKEYPQMPLVLASKFSPFYPWRLTGKQLLNALKGSLKRLNKTQLDIYYLHSPGGMRPYRVWLEALAEAYQEGLIKAVGISNFNLNQTRDAYEFFAQRNVPLSCHQFHFSLLHRAPELNGMMTYCKEMNISVISYMALAQGLLTGKYTPQNPPSGSRGRNYPPEKLAKLQPLLDVMREIGAEHGDKTPSQVAINYAICKDTIPLVGVKTVRQAAENLGALDFRLSEVQVNRLDEKSQDLQNLMVTRWTSV